MANVNENTAKNRAGERAVEAAGISADWGEALRRIAEISTQLAAEHITTEACDLAERVSEGRFYLACVGQFKRGKSTLIDALVGEHILPTGVIPVTTVPTVIRYGDKRVARVRIRGTWSDISPADLEQYVSEEHNPENTKEVAGVEVFLPAPLLKSGMCLVDTPGLGSVFTGNAAATEAFIPHIDAAMVVVGADPPIAGDEVNLVEAVGQHVRDLLVVLNKADRVSDAERGAAGAFARKILERRLNRPVGHIFEVSAFERLHNRGPGRDWDLLLNALGELVGQSGRLLIGRAGRRGVERLSEQTLAIVAEERRALLQPIEESERRIAAMRETLSDAERSMRDLGYLFMAEQQRLHDMFLDRRKRFLDNTRPAAHAELQEWLRSASRHGGPSFRRVLFQQAQEIARAAVLPWLKTEQEHAERIYREATGRFVELANQFLQRLADTGVPELARMPHALDADRGLRGRSRFQFYDFITVAQPASPLRLAADAILGVLGIYGPIEREGDEFLGRLLEANSSRVQSDLDDRVLESRRGLETDIRVLLREVSAAASRALEHAKTARAAGSAAVEAALARLAQLEREVQELMRFAAESALQ